MAVWWIVDAVVLIVVVPVVILLANRVIRAGLEIERYADDILEHGVALSANLEPVPALATTLELVEIATRSAVSYVDGLRSLLGV